MSKLLDWLNEECCSLMPLAYPTGGDDHDVIWTVIRYQMAQPCEVEIGHGRTATAAIEDAMKDANDPTRWDYVPPQFRDDSEKEPTLVPGCHRSHPHEDMSAECERLTEVAREDNRRAGEKSQRCEYRFGTDRCDLDDGHGGDHSHLTNEGRLRLTAPKATTPPRLAHQIADAQQRIASWPADVREATRIEVEGLGEGTATSETNKRRGAPDCPKCGGAGWLRGSELEDADEDTCNDTMTQYSCDSPQCRDKRLQSSEQGTNG